MHFANCLPDFHFPFSTFRFQFFKHFFMIGFKCFDKRQTVPIIACGSNNRLERNSSDTAFVQCLDERINCLIREIVHNNHFFVKAVTVKLFCHRRNALDACKETDRLIEIFFFNLFNLNFQRHKCKLCLAKSFIRKVVKHSKFFHIFTVNPYQA